MNARVGSGQLPSDFAAKAIYISRPKPLRDRPWFRWLVLGGFVAGLLVALVAGALVYDWRRTVKADLAAQHRSLSAFLHSEEFSQFVGAADAQLVALNNFIVAQPTAARAALPEIEAVEQKEKRLSWTLELMPLPTSAAADPARVLRALRPPAAQLAQRGFQFDDAATPAGRQLFIRLLSPHARAFLERTQGHGFNALTLDATMQDEAFVAFAERHGANASRDDATRVFALYAKIGPAMWQAIERDRAEHARQIFADFKPSR